MLATPSFLVADGSYESKDDSGAAAFILETEDKLSRVSNAHLVPENPPTITHKCCDPYRCELFSLFSGLLTPYDLEQRFAQTFATVTVCVDNDTALDKGAAYTGPIQATDQHFDILQSIRSLRVLLRTPIVNKNVQGHRDRDIPRHELSHVESLNYECDLIAKFARVHMQAFPHLQPTLRLPFESISIWNENSKIYQDFNAAILDLCSLPRIRSYYMTKYQWDIFDFDNVNWTAIQSAMKLCSTSTRTWISKMNCGFIGSATMLVYREYWLSNNCPMCQSCQETNIHVLQCAHPPHRQKLLLMIDELSKWLTITTCEPIIARKIIRITNLWLDQGTRPDLFSTCPPIQQQIQIGWYHFMFGKISLDITQWQHNYATIHNLRREAQSWTSRLIQRLWTIILRPSWQHRNIIVHANDRTTSKTRLCLDIQEEVTELYNSTNVDMLASVDRPLFDPPLDDLLSKPYFQLKAWCSSVETAQLHSLNSTSVTHDPSQPALTFAQPLPPPPADPPRQPLPTARNSPPLDCNPAAYQETSNAASPSR